jgi:hypothetical protein
VEKYLRDTIATDRLEMEDEMTNKNTMPRYLVRVQFKADSTRAADYADQTGDSSRWLKYQTPSYRYMLQDTSDHSRSPILANLRKPAPYKSALAERLARIRALTAAQDQGGDSSQPSRQPSSSQPTPGDTGSKRRPPPKDTTQP